MMPNDALDPAQLEAGPELDVEVQRVVFRTKIKTIRCPNDNPDWPMYIPSGKPWRTHAIDAVPVPKYSTSIEAAWLIVARLTAQGFIFELFTQTDAAARFFRERNRSEMPRHGYWAVGETAPLAIVRAALNAAAPPAAATPGTGGLISVDD
jgi:hypothetical protein